MTTTAKAKATKQIVFTIEVAQNALAPDPAAITEALQEMPSVLDVKVVQAKMRNVESE